MKISEKVRIKKEDIVKENSPQNREDPFYHFTNPISEQLRKLLILW